jgi:CRISPR-associated protein Csd2
MKNMSLTKKIDFAVIIGVKNANPNGDPLNGNRPRVNYDGYGEISDVCIKRKIRNRLMDGGEAILVQSDDYRNDNSRSIKDRYDTVMKVLLPKSKDGSEKAAASCKTWFDVRAFGQVLAGVDSDNASIAIRGPVSIQSAFSVEPVEITSMQITKSVNLVTDPKKDPSVKAGDTMGMKHRVDKGIYVTYGSINRQLAEKTGFSDDDAEKLKNAMTRLFENDESSARPAGSMEVLKVIWWTHADAVLPSAKVHKSLRVNADGTYALETLEGLAVEELDGR